MVVCFLETGSPTYQRLILLDLDDQFFIVTFLCARACIPRMAQGTVRSKLHACYDQGVLQVVAIAGGCFVRLPFRDNLFPHNLQLCAGHGASFLVMGTRSPSVVDKLRRIFTTSFDGLPRALYV